MGIQTLAKFKPRNVGAVGPIDEINPEFMTHDMVHRTHLDIFKTYYPTVFSAWWVDNWITIVYRSSRSVISRKWRVEHHAKQYPMRYVVQYNESKFFCREIEEGWKTLASWLAASERDAAKRGGDSCKSSTD